MSTDIELREKVGRLATKVEELACVVRDQQNIIDGLLASQAEDREHIEHNEDQTRDLRSLHNVTLGMIGVTNHLVLAVASGQPRGDIVKDVVEKWNKLRREVEALTSRTSEPLSFEQWKAKQE